MEISESIFSSAYTFFWACLCNMTSKCLLFFLLLFFQSNVLAILSYVLFLKFPLRPFADQHEEIQKLATKVFLTSCFLSGLCTVHSKAEESDCNPLNAAVIYIEWYQELGSVFLFGSVWWSNYLSNGAISWYQNQLSAHPRRGLYIAIDTPP